MELDELWDGLKGYITNSKLAPINIISNYNQLWKIEKAFRISKTDLRIRPIYHFKKLRIESHICIAFVAYALFKELERILLTNKINLSAQKAIEHIKAIYSIYYTLPDSQENIIGLGELNKEQKDILNVCGGTQI